MKLDLLLIISMKKITIINIYIYIYFDLDLELLSIRFDKNPLTKTMFFFEEIRFESHRILL